ncbi:MAG TPA: MBL fold metallo-hydrolase [Luteimonas sp.]|nr:MBL fold metallo-hydrolase [Luteimonas sp.]
MKTILLGSILALAAAAPLRALPSESVAPGTTLHSYLQARDTLARAIQAAGGEAGLRRLRNVSLSYAGHRNMINQSRRAFPPWDREPASGAVVVDREGKRLFAENYTSYPGIGRFGGAWALKGNVGAHWEPDRNHHGSELIGRYSGRDADGPWAMVSRWIPPLMLLDALDSGTGLRSLGSVTRGDKPMRAVAWTQRDGATVTLLFDGASGAFSGYESVRDDGVYGDATDRIEYSDWRAIGDARFPARRTDWFNGEVARELKLDYRVDTQLADRLFEVPQGYTEPGAAETGERLRKIGDGVYLDTHMGGVMVVEFGDYLAVVECPGDYAMSLSTIEALREAFPGKPVRYVIPSHTHGDHGGGARAYFQAGATLLTTPGHVDFYRQLAQVRRSLSPDPYVVPRDGPSIEVFRGKREIGDSKQTLVLYDIGPNAHSQELTIAHLPKQGIVWQADVYFSPGTGDGMKPAMPIGIDFAKKLKSLGIRDFEALLEAHNSRIVTAEEFRRALALSGYRDY